MKRHIILDLNVILMKIFHVQSKDNMNWTKEHWNEIVKYQFTQSVIDYITERFLMDRHYDSLWICADGHMSWRKSVDPLYKANRISDPDDPIDMPKVFREVFEYARVEIEKYFGLNIIKAPHVEGDDMVFFLVNKLAEDSNNDITVFTIDHDLWQILRPNVYIIDQKFNPVTVKTGVDDIAIQLESMMDECAGKSSFKQKGAITDTGTTTYIDDASMIWKVKILDGDVSDNIRGAFVRKKEVKDNKNGGTKMQNKKLTAKEKAALFEELGDKEFTYENVWPIVKNFKGWETFEDEYESMWGEGDSLEKHFKLNDVLIRMAIENYPEEIKESFRKIYAKEDEWSDAKLSTSVNTFLNNMVPYVPENLFEAQSTEECVVDIAL